MAYPSLLMILSLILLCRAYPTLEAYGDRNTTTISKRTFGVYPLQDLERMSKLATSKHAPWPEIEPPQGPRRAYLRYCFRNTRSSQNLAKIVAQGIALWTPAFKYSSLSIVPDFACFDNSRESRSRWDYYCVCGPKTADDTLVIDDEWADEQHLRGAETSVGYDYSSKARGRHAMSFSPALREIKGADTAERVAGTMAHELGHAIGLAHEHQRPDRRTYIAYSPQNLEGYEAAMKKAQEPANSHRFVEGASPKEKMDGTVQEYEVAEALFPIACDYVRSDMGLPEGYDLDTSNLHEGFDYNSIMIYSSEQNIMPPWETSYKDKLFPIARRMPGSTELQMIWQGGHFSHPRISAWDIKRVAVLYPGTPQEQQAAKELVQWEDQTVDMPPLIKKLRIGPNKLNVVNERLEPIAGTTGDTAKDLGTPGSGKGGKWEKLKNKLKGAAKGGKGSESGSGSGTPGVSKRWNSIYDLATLRANGIALNNIQSGPWPVINGYPRLRYCYKNQRSVNNLHEYLAQAIALWAPAYEYSSVRIEPDLACQSLDNPEMKNYKCLCGQQDDRRRTASDALILDDGRDDGDDANGWIKFSETTLGYEYARDAPGRHGLTFGALNHYEEIDVLTKNHLTTRFAHELGHALGLDHEHQRADRDKYILYQPKYFRGYDQAVELIKQKGGHIPGKTVEEKMEAVLEDEDLARDYFPDAEDYVKGKGNDYEDATTYDASGFDFGSITLYDTAQSCWTVEQIREKRCVMLRKHADGSTSVTRMGSDENNGRISASDITRIAVLYPGDVRQQERARDLKQWPETAVEVQGLFDRQIVRPHPVDLVGPNLEPIEALKGGGAAARGGVWGAGIAVGNTPGQSSGGTTPQAGSGGGKGSKWSRLKNKIKGKGGKGGGSGSGKGGQAPA